MSNKNNFNSELDFHARLLKRAEELAGIGHWHVDILNDNKIFWSDEIFRIHGRNINDGVPSLEKAIDYYHPDDRDLVQEHVNKAITDGGIFTFEARLVRDSGDLRYIQSNGECEKNDSGEVVAMFGVFNDITDFKIREQEALRSSQSLKLILDNIPDLIFIKDNNYTIVEANEYFLNMYPKDVRDKVIGTTTLENYDEEQMLAFTKNDREALDHGYNETIENVDFPNGDRKTLFTKKVGYTNYNNERFLLGISRDITDIKQAQEELMRSNIELERFAYIASHDLQEPLRMIKNFSGLLDDEYSDQLDDTAKQYIQFSRDAANRMQNLIEDLLEYSRIGNQDVTIEETNAENKLKIALENLSEIIVRKNAAITFDTMPSVFANPLRLTRLFQNLISNAIKYCDNKPIIHIGYNEDDVQHIFSIKDNGIGIDEDYYGKIFEIFQRLHGKKSYEGTGIGLAICKKIVDTMGGNMWVDSTLSEGSIFYFTLPKIKQ